MFDFTNTLYSIIMNVVGTKGIYTDNVAWFVLRIKVGRPKTG